MLRIKICGITRREDALIAAELGADALGFVFYPGSPRCISPEHAAEISEQLPAHVARVGVLVDPSPATVRQVIAALRLDALQLHRLSRLAGVLDCGGLPVIPALAVKDTVASDQLSWLAAAPALLLDAHHQHLPGGTGRRLDWRMVRSISRRHRVILAGGLNPENVATAVCLARPYAVDVASGLEERPGIKDHQKMKRFFINLKEFRYEWSIHREQLFPLA